jgi:ankyrin repeat protein
MNAGDNPEALLFLLDQPSIDASIESIKEHHSFPAGISPLEIGQYRAKKTVGTHQAFEILQAKYKLLATKKYLKNGGDPNELSQPNDSILSQLIRNSNMTEDTSILIQLLIEKGADVNTLDGNQFNPLMNCLLKMMQLGDDLDKKKHTYYTQIAEALIQNDINLSLAKPNSNQKVLRDAGDISESIGKVIASKLIQDYPNYVEEFDHQDGDGFTAIHTAARKGHTNLLKLLVQHGANINIPENYGFIPLHEAIIAAHYNTVKFLIDSGADLTHTITEGYGPYEPGDNAAAIANKAGDQKIAQLFA